jgi:hypothetical protein
MKMVHLYLYGKSVFTQLIATLSLLERDISFQAYHNVKKQMVKNNSQEWDEK